MNELPQIPFAHLPTPIEEMPRLAEILGGPRLFVKRDDQTGLVMGGNKTRKLEYLVAEAQKHNSKTLITAGAIQSNHCRQTAAAARRVGMDCVLVLNGEEPDLPEGNTYLDFLMGAEIIWVKDRDDRGRMLSSIYQKAEADGRKPYLIPYGGSSPIGAAAYAYAVREMVNQNINPDWIIFATSSGGTHAGLTVGARLLNLESQILGISVDEPAEKLKAIVAPLATETAKLLGSDETFSEENVLVNTDYLGAGYAIMGDSEIEAIKLFASSEALLIDPVYTGRAAAGMIDLIRKGFFDSDSTILFWHTGGTPALFTDQYRQGLMAVS